MLVASILPVPLELPVHHKHLVSCEVAASKQAGSVSRIFNRCSISAGVSLRDSAGNIRFNFMKVAPLLFVTSGTISFLRREVVRVQYHPLTSLIRFSQNGVHNSQSRPGANRITVINSCKPD